MKGGYKLRRAQVLRWILAKFRGRTVELSVESDRWVGLPREDRSCTQCGSGEVEDAKHFLLRSTTWQTREWRWRSIWKRLWIGFKIDGQMR